MKNVGIGVCLLVTRAKKLLIAERLSAHGKGYLACPGGHQEKNERWDQAAIRELREEAGYSLKVNIVPNYSVYFKSESNIPIFVTNNILENGSHYVTVWLRSYWIAGEAVNSEPSKKKDWEWKTFDEIVKDPRMQAGKEAWLGGGMHDALHWIPLPEIYRHRERIGL